MTSIKTDEIHRWTGKPRSTTGCPSDIYNDCKSVRGVGNPVHALHSDLVVACQPLRAWYTRA